MFRFDATECLKWSMMHVTVEQLAQYEDQPRESIPCFAGWQIIASLTNWSLPAHQSITGLTGKTNNYHTHSLFRITS